MLIVMIYTSVLSIRWLKRDVCLVIEFGISMVRSWLSFWSPSSALARAIVHTPTVSLILLLQFLFILLYFFYRRQGDRRNVLDFEKSLIYTHIVYYTRSLPYDRGIYGRTRGEDDIIIYSNNDNNIPVRTLCARMVRTYNYMTGR